MILINICPLSRKNSPTSNCACQLSVPAGKDRLF